MKIKNITIETRLSHDYNSFSTSLEVQIEEGDDVKEVRKKLQKATMNSCKEAIDAYKAEKNDK